MIKMWLLVLVTYVDMEVASDGRDVVGARGGDNRDVVGV